MATISGGSRADKVLAQIGAQLARGKSLKVGFLEGATYPDGKSVAGVAAINNFGSEDGHTPARSFFTDLVADKADSWGADVAKLLSTEGYDSHRTLETMGLRIQGQLRKAIVDTLEPPNAPSTIRRKGHDKPLEDTKLMLTSVDYETS